MSEISEKELKEGEKFKIAYEIAEKVLSHEAITEEEREILRPVHARVAMAMSAKRCRGVAGTITVQYDEWDKDKKEWVKGKEKVIPRISQCVGLSMMDIDVRLRGATGR